MGGNLYLTGDQDRPPIPIGYPQAYFHAGAEAAVASLVALYHKEMTGVGQLVDVSIQESLLRTTFQSMLTWNLENLIVTRLGSKRMWGKGLTLTMCWPCKDGYVLFTALVGPIAGRMMKALGKWMGDEGFGDAFISGTDWESISAVDVTTEDIERTAEAIEPFFANYTKKELFEKSIERDIMLFPVSSAQDILSNVHLAERHFWQTLQQPELEDVLKYPKPPFQIDGEYPTIRRRAPRIGEHNAEVYGELLSLAPKEVLAFEEEGII
jgi:crotonobetainyl-CoA:carnitine CoA-transferase CaiB-like acyl-CoA transferase